MVFAVAGEKRRPIVAACQHRPPVSAAGEIDCMARFFQTDEVRLEAVSAHIESNLHV